MKAHHCCRPFAFVVRSGFSQHGAGVRIVQTQFEASAAGGSVELQRHAIVSPGPYAVSGSAPTPVVQPVSGWTKVSSPMTFGDVAGARETEHVIGGLPFAH